MARRGWRGSIGLRDKPGREEGGARDRRVRGGEFFVGGWGVIRDVNDAHVQEIGAWAVAEHVKRASDGLRFGRVAGGERLLVAGYNYRLRIDAVNLAGQNVTYNAVVYEQPWTNTRQLVSFDRAE
nr:unnamed protein product [Digitaria exilis]